MYERGMFVRILFSSSMVLIWSIFLSILIIVAIGQYYWSKQEANILDSEERDVQWIEKQQRLYKELPLVSLADLEEVHRLALVDSIEQQEQMYDLLFAKVVKAYHASPLDYIEVVRMYGDEASKQQKELDTNFYMLYEKMQQDLLKYGYHSDELDIYLLDYEVLRSQKQLAYSIQVATLKQ